ncbi:MAG TPA: FGGY-family carbohydrate kinase [Acidimicrobiales bacterium]|nr:FGGY-family carbohydrate kinase [Acidimicrobiales bacterium]
MTALSQSSAESRGPLTVGIDIGTTAVKAVLVDEDGRALARQRLDSALRTGPRGEFEHDAVATWWEAPRQALGELLLAAPQPPVAVAVSAMMPSVAAVAPGGKPLGRGLLYGDRRGAAPGAPAAGRAAARADERGADPTASFEMARLAAAAAADGTDVAGCWPAQAVANASLCGEGVVDLATAFACGRLFGGAGWDAEVCWEYGLRPGLLPRVAMFGERVGDLRAEGGLFEAAQGSGHRQVALATGAVDGLCEQLVSGAVNDGDVLITLGSALVVWLCVPGWPEVAPGLWRVPHFAAGKAMVGGASNAGGMWVDWAGRVLGAGTQPAAGPALAPPVGTQPVGTQPVGTQPVGPVPGGPANIPLWWPWARGERVPWHDPALRITLAGAHLAQGPAALRRAALEASAFAARYIVERAAQTGTAPRRYLVSGGGSANPAWLQALADVLGEQITPVAAPDGAALGAAFLARMAAGLERGTDDAPRWARYKAPVEPVPDWAAAAADRYQDWLAGLPAAASAT